MKWADYFTYDVASPSGLRWAVDRRGGVLGNIVLAHAGDVAGSLDIRKRWSVSFNNQNYLVHRVVYELYHGQEIGDYQIDHIDGDTSNNIISNLRKVTATGNGRNRAMNSRNSTGHNGVAEANGHFRATWVEGGKLRVKSFSIRKYGYDLSLEMAVRCRASAVERMNSNGAGYTERHGK